jgi:predicted ArsR family transcriptional regulator
MDYLTQSAVIFCLHTQQLSHYTEAVRKTAWTMRFFGTTRGQILERLCYGTRTVSELAGRLHLTNNAVRAHLAALVRDGLVQPIGTRRGTRKPYVTYDLTAQGQRLFPKAHEPVLRELLNGLSDRLPRTTLNSLLREVGQRLEETYLPGIRRLSKRDRLARLMEALGSAAQLEREGKRESIRGCGCPLGSLAASHPEICQLAAELVGGMIGAEVQEHCDRSSSPRCCFELRGV